MWQDLLCLAISSGATTGGRCQLCHQKVEEKDTTLESGSVLNMSNTLILIDFDKELQSLKSHILLTWTPTSQPRYDDPTLCYIVAGTQVWWSTTSWPALRLQIFMKVWNLQSLPMICVHQSLQISPRFWVWSQEFWNEGVGWTWKTRKTMKRTPKDRNPSQPWSRRRRQRQKCQKCHKRQKHPRCSTWYWSHNPSPRGSLKQWDNMKAKNETFLWKCFFLFLEVFFGFAYSWWNIHSASKSSRSQRNCPLKGHQLMQIRPWGVTRNRSWRPLPRIVSPLSWHPQVVVNPLEPWLLGRGGWHHIGCVCEFPPGFSMVDTPFVIFFRSFPFSF